MIRTALIAAAALVIANVIPAGPAAAQGNRNQGGAIGASALMTGPGGCEGWNRAVADAVATQLRRGDRAEAMRLSRLARTCPR